MVSENPFAAPEAALNSNVLVDRTTGEGLWRDGKVLVVRKDAEFPDRCIVCNESAKGIRLQQKFTWHNPWWYLLLPINLLLYLIVALIVSHRATIDLGICDVHRSRRDVMLGGGFFTVVIGLTTIIYAIVDERQRWLFIVGAILLLLGLLVAAFGGRVTYPKRINDRFVWLAKVHSDYLASLPNWEGEA